MTVIKIKKEEEEGRKGKLASPLPAEVGSSLNTLVMRGADEAGRLPTG